MGRTRYIKPSFFKDEHLKDLPYTARLLFAGLWTQADREGRLEDRPERLKIEIFPYDKKLDINKLLEMLAKPKLNSCRPFIYRYEVEGEKYIQITNWHKHQKVHHTEPNSSTPPIPPNFNFNFNYISKCSSPKLEEGNGETTVVLPLSPSNSGNEQKKDKFLEFVLLTKEEYSKLCERIGEETTNEWITRLNNYIGSKGKKYNSHYHTILTWIRNEQPIIKGVSQREL